MLTACQLSGSLPTMRAGLPAHTEKGGQAVPSTTTAPRSTTTQGLTMQRFPTTAPSPMVTWAPMLAASTTAPLQMVT